LHSSELRQAWSTRCVPTNTAAQSGGNAGASGPTQSQPSKRRFSSAVQVASASPSSVKVPRFNAAVTSPLHTGARSVVAAPPQQACRRSATSVCSVPHTSAASGAAASTRSAAKPTISQQTAIHPRRMVPLHRFDTRPTAGGAPWMR
jgi:hypothetical protein